MRIISQSLNPYNSTTNFISPFRLLPTDLIPPYIREQPINTVTQNTWLAAPTITYPSIVSISANSDVALQAPIITINYQKIIPKEETVRVLVGTSLQFGVEVDDNSISNNPNIQNPLTYVWKKDGNLLEKINRLNSTVVSISSTSCTQEVTGVYTCEVSNIYGTTTTDPLTIEVINPFEHPKLYKNLITNGKGESGLAGWEVDSDIKVSAFATPKFDREIAQQFNSFNIGGIGVEVGMNTPPEFQFSIGSHFGMFHRLFKKRQVGNLTFGNAYTKGTSAGGVLTEHERWYSEGGSIPQIIPNEDYDTNNYSTTAGFFPGLAWMDNYNKNNNNKIIGLSQEYADTTLPFYFTRDKIKFVNKGGRAETSLTQTIDLSNVADIIDGNAYGVTHATGQFFAYVGAGITDYKIKFEETGSVEPTIANYYIADFEEYKEYFQETWRDSELYNGIVFRSTDTTLPTQSLKQVLATLPNEKQSSNTIEELVALRQEFFSRFLDPNTGPQTPAYSPFSIDTTKDANNKYTQAFTKTNWLKKSGGSNADYTPSKGYLFDPLFNLIPNTEWDAMVGVPYFTESITYIPVRPILKRTQLESTGTTSSREWEATEQNKPEMTSDKYRTAVKSFTYYRVTNPEMPSITWCLGNMLTKSNNDVNDPNELQNGGLGEDGNPDQNGDDSGDFSSWYNGEAGTGIPRHWYHNIGQWLADDNYQPWRLMRDSFSQVREFLNAKGLHDIMWSELVDTPYGKSLHNVINELIARPDHYYPSKVNVGGKYGSGDWNEWWYNRGNNLSVWHSHASEHVLTYVIPIMKVMYDMTLEVFKKITQQIQATLLKAELIIFIKNTNYTFSRNAQKKIKRGIKRFSDIEIQPKAYDKTKIELTYYDAQNIAIRTETVNGPDEQDVWAIKEKVFFPLTLYPIFLSLGIDTNFYGIPKSEIDKIPEKYKLPFLQNISGMTYGADGFQVGGDNFVTVFGQPYTSMRLLSGIANIINGGINNGVLEKGINSLTGPIYNEVSPSTLGVEQFISESVIKKLTIDYTNGNAFTEYSPAYLQSFFGNTYSSNKVGDKNANFLMNNYDFAGYGGAYPPQNSGFGKQPNANPYTNNAVYDFGAAAMFGVGITAIIPRGARSVQIKVTFEHTSDVIYDTSPETKDWKYDEIYSNQFGQKINSSARTIKYGNPRCGITNMKYVIAANNFEQTDRYPSYNMPPPQSTVLGLEKEKYNINDTQTLFAAATANTAERVSRINTLTLPPPPIVIENLYTAGGEYLLAAGGEVYVGYYHIHNTKGPMVGRTHIDTFHGYLYPIESL